MWRRAGQLLILSGFAILIGMQPVHAQDRTLELVPFKAYVLPIGEAEMFFSQCSRPSPPQEVAKTAWLPSAAEIAKLEKDLVPFMAQLQGITLPDYFWTHGYARQYMGYKIGSHKFIYGSFFPSSDNFDNAAHKAVTVCDGGPVFWGIVYDVDADKFETPYFNGGA